MLTTSDKTDRQPSPGAKTKVEKAQSYLALISTGLGVLGAVGTGFVWLLTTFFLGNVHVEPDKPVDTVFVKVIDKKGQSSTYYGKDLQLMPGRYHLEVGVPDRQPTTHADVDVHLWKQVTIPLAVPEATGGAGQSATSTAADQSAAESGKKRWWQFWKKKQQQ
jgi:hypothetical protein